MTASVVVTGLGVAAPNGLGGQDFWNATLAGKSGLGPLTHFDASGYPARLAGEIGDFVAEGQLPSRLMPQTDRVTRLSLVAADWALADAGVRPAELPEFRMGVSTASSAGGFAFSQHELKNLWSKGSQYVSAYQSFAWFYAVNTGQISIRNGMKGPSGVVVTDQAGGLDAVAQARRQIRKGTSSSSPAPSTRCSAPGDGPDCTPAAASAPPTSRPTPTCPSTTGLPATWPVRAAPCSSWSRVTPRGPAAPGCTARSPGTPPPSTDANPVCARPWSSPSWTRP